MKLKVIFWHIKTTTNMFKGSRNMHTSHGIMQMALVSHPTIGCGVSKRSVYPINRMTPKANMVVEKDLMIVVEVVIGDHD